MYPDPVESTHTDSHTHTHTDRGHGPVRVVKVDPGCGGVTHGENRRDLGHVGTVRWGLSDLSTSD